VVEHGTASVFVPLGPWPVYTTSEEQRNSDTMGELMAENVLEFSDSCRPLFASAGVDGEVVQGWIDNLHTGRTFGCDRVVMFY
jgi:hypothetical protein